MLYYFNQQHSHFPNTHALKLIFQLTHNFQSTTRQTSKTRLTALFQFPSINPTTFYHQLYNHQPTNKAVYRTVLQRQHKLAGASISGREADFNTLTLNKPIHQFHTAYSFQQNNRNFKLIVFFKQIIVYLIHFLFFLFPP